MIIEFEQMTGAGRHMVTRTWGVCPRVGEAVDFDGEDDREDVFKGMRGTVRSVTWSSQGRAKVVLEPRLSRVMGKFVETKLSVREIANLPPGVMP